MTLTDTQRLDAAMRLIRVVTGERYGDGDRVTDVGIGYAGNDSGYRSDVWVTGNWNDRTHYVDGERIVDDNTMSRLFDALERIGVNGEWLDEWNRCDDCSKLIRTQPDSYCWTPQYLVDDCGYLCHDCAIDALPDSLDSYVNHESCAVTWLSESQLAEHGWTDAFPDERDSAHGWHPGQDDKPADSVARLRESGDQRDYLFVITEKGQFDIHYRMMVCDNDNDNDNDESE